MGSHEPLVSCVMPTWNRRAFIPAAIDCWMRQTYRNRELVILDDGEEPIEDLIPQNPQIRYIFEDRRRITGDKRNRCCELAAGEIICHFDDDDWSAPERIERQVRTLIETGKPITGYGTLLFWHVERRRALIYRARMAGYICGTTMSYLKSFWRTRPFRAKHEASDNDFISPILRQVASSTDCNQMVARIHGVHHTSSKTGIRNAVPPESIPAQFWSNEKLRLRCG